MDDLDDLEFDLPMRTLVGRIVLSMKFHLFPYLPTTSHAFRVRHPLLLLTSLMRDTHAWNFCPLSNSLSLSKNIPHLKQHCPICPSHSIACHSICLFYSIAVFSFLSFHHEKHHQDDVDDNKVIKKALLPRKPVCWFHSIV